MTIRWRDVSILMKNGMTVWPGDPPFVFAPDSRIAEGASCNTSALQMGTHTGTHMDAPWHFDESGAKLDAVDISLFAGPALLLDMGEKRVIRAEDLGTRPLPPRVLIKTVNARIPADAPFAEDYVALDVSAAERLVDEGVRLVCVDYLSVAPFKQPGQRTHHILLGAGVLVVEGLRLAGFDEGTYELIVLPLPLAGADGAPCRALLGKSE